MKLTQLVSAIESAHQALRDRTVRSDNTALTIRNWMVGFNIVEFEQKGERAIPGVSKMPLILFRALYKAYSHIHLTLTDRFNLPLDRPLPMISGKFKTVFFLKQLEPFKTKVETF